SFTLYHALVVLCSFPTRRSSDLVSQFVFVQWVAPFVSEFPEKVSAFYWARTVKGSPTALMNMVSSNINQWTLLAAMLPIVYSMRDRKSTRLNSSHEWISYAVFCV